MLISSSKDLEYIYTLMNKRGGCGVISTPTIKTIEVLIMDVLHNVIMNKSYVVKYPEKKGASVTEAPVDVDVEKDKSADETSE